MSALALDDFSLEMCQHYISETLADLARFQMELDFTPEIREAVEGWIAEAQSNEMPYFVRLLELVKNAQSLNADAVRPYLEALVTQGDSEELFQKYHQIFVSETQKTSELYLECSSGDYQFLIPVRQVIEIVNNRKVYSLPVAQKGVRGLMSFRGQAIPVMDLSAHGFLLTEEQGKKKAYFVVCELAGSFFGVEVNSTENVVELESSQLQSAKGSMISSPFIEQFILRENKTLMLLNIEKLVSN